MASEDIFKSRPSRGLAADPPGLELVVNPYNVFEPRPGGEVEQKFINPYGISGFKIFSNKVFLFVIHSDRNYDLHLGPKGFLNSGSQVGWIERGVGPRGSYLTLPCHPQPWGTFGCSEVVRNWSGDLTGLRGSCRVR